MLFKDLLEFYRLQNLYAKADDYMQPEHLTFVENG